MLLVVLLVSLLAATAIAAAGVWSAYRDPATARILLVVAVLVATVPTGVVLWAWWALDQTMLSIVGGPR